MNNVAKSVKEGGIKKGKAAKISVKAVCLGVLYLEGFPLQGKVGARRAD